MRAIGTDTFAMTNPALTSILLWQFVKSFEEATGSGPTLSLCYIVLPIVMSRSMVESFAGTNVATGLLTWLTRHPELPLKMPGRIGNTRELTAKAIRFGIAYRLFTVKEDGTI